MKSLSANIDYLATIVTYAAIQEWVDAVNEQGGFIRWMFKTICNLSEITDVFIE